MGYPLSLFLVACFFSLSVIALPLVSPSSEVTAAAPLLNSISSTEEDQPEDPIGYWLDVWLALLYCFVGLVVLVQWLNRKINEIGAAAFCVFTVVGVVLTALTLLCVPRLRPLFASIQGGVLGLFLVIIIFLGVKKEADDKARREREHLLKSGSK
ncbi:hypothetical protein BJ508DRAFT_304111 [Ascobolus immersus RN42]|uniref:Uncharacterized protein n=1 Tax=Ascobolus immersus RN42 TaxID=1160509 RepID=A0A3N4IQS2_ASCIM|nr:hypothetical protein BJ508DRAFT_304111 [Ascobolus immersus RN42]